ncbi:MAG: hypothetical protein J5898_10085 [Lachnospiraceae bacterium]|nr:hypothetical protein [Lachnospiraceae bacterium]
MVSRRNFVTMIILMLIMIFMFMFSSVVKHELNEYGINSYGENTQDITALRKAYDALFSVLFPGRSAQQEALDGKFREKGMIFLGQEKDNAVASNVKNWAVYNKRPSLFVTTLQEISSLDTTLWPEVLVIDGETVDWDAETEQLLRLVKKGMCVIFARMPSKKDMERNEALRQVTGVKEIRENQGLVTGLHLFPGLLIGGEAIYQAKTKEEDRQDLDLDFPWYVIGAGTKTYMMGTVSDKTMEKELLPAVLWRCRLGDGVVFCVNGDYLEEEAGIGFLTGFMADKDSYDLYPVVNAQNLVLESYGGFTSENNGQLGEIYNQTQVTMFRDLIWPTIVALNERTGGKITMMVSPQMDYSDDKEPIRNQLIYYLRLLNEVSGEAGVSCARRSDITVKEKLEKDLEYWEQEAPDYRLQAVCTEELQEFPQASEVLKDLKTVVTKQNPDMAVGYLEDDVTVQKVTGLGMRHTYRDNLALKAYETALGYSNIMLDMEQAAYPGGEEEHWEKIALKFTSNLDTYWKDYVAFDHTTLSESDARIRRFLALDYSDHREKERITLHVEHFDEEAYFVLKLNREEVKEIRGASYQKLRNGFYLLKIQEQDVEIEVEKVTIPIH